MEFSIKRYWERNENGEWVKPGWRICVDSPCNVACFYCQNGDEAARIVDGCWDQFLQWHKNRDQMKRKEYLKRHYIEEEYIMFYESLSILFEQMKKFAADDVSRQEDLINDCNKNLYYFKSDKLLLKNYNEWLAALNTHGPKMRA